MPYRERKSVRDRLSEKLDRQLLKLLRGRPAFLANGEPVLDADGKQVMKPPSAADLDVIAKRLRNLAQKPEVPEETWVERIKRRAGGKLTLE